MKRQGRSFNDNPKCAEREAVLCERLCTSGVAPFLVEPVACPVLSRSCFGVDAQQLVTADPDSIVRRNPWISGAKVNEEPHPQVLGRKFLDSKERLSICRHMHPFKSLISVCRDDVVCCVLLLNLALFNLIVVINQRALSVFPTLQRWRVCITFAFGECLLWFAALVILRMNRFFWNIVGSFVFCLCLG